MLGGRAAADFTHSHGRKVEEVMSDSPYSVSEDTTLDEIVRLMERHRIKRVPVTRDAHLVGIVSRANLMRAMISIVRSAQPPAQSDLDIRSRIMTEMDTQKWAPVALVEVTVNKGVVDLSGHDPGRARPEGPEGACGNVPGVKSVNDHMVWVEPTSAFTSTPMSQEV